MTAGPAGTKTTQLWRTLERHLPDGFSARYQWLWILPADAVPAPDALERLEDRLFTVKDEATHFQVEIVGAKQLHADAPEPRLVNAGLWSAGSGEVVTLTEPRELDQGQYDGRDQVPAVSAHGMLIHAGLFGDLGGFDPALPGDYAAADLCARAREVGALTVLEPTARSWRPTPPPREVVHRYGGTLWLPAPQRRGQIRARLAQANPIAVPFLWVGLWVAAALRLIALMICKAPDAALGQFFASASALLNWAAVAHVRRFRAQGRKAALARPERLRQLSTDTHQNSTDKSSDKTADKTAARAILTAGRSAVAQDRLDGEKLRSQRRRDITAETVGLHALRTGRRSNAQPGSIDQDDALIDIGSGDGEFDEMPARRSEDRLGLFIVLTALIGVSLVAFRDLLTAPALGGGAAMPVSGSIGEVWQHTVSFLAADSLGERAAADPFSLLLLVFSVLSAGHASAVLLWIVILAAPLSAATAWWAAGLWSSKAFHRVLAALIWALVPALHTAVGQGRLGAVIAHILLPLVVMAGVRALRARKAHALHTAEDSVPGTRVASLRLATGWETAAGAGILLALTTAAAPVLLVPAVLICAVGGLLGGRTARVLWLIPVPALALFAPMLISAVDRGANVAAVLLAEPGRVLSSAQAGMPAPLWQQLLGYSQAFDAAGGLPGASGIDAWLPALFNGSFWTLRIALLTGAPLLVIALLAIVAAGRRRLVLIAGLIALGAAGFSVLSGLLAAGTADGELLPAYSGPLVSVIVLCLIVAALSALEVSSSGESVFGGLFAPVAATLLVLAVFASGVLWAAPRILPASERGEQTVTAINEQPVLIGPGAERTIPSTAADQGRGPAALRTLVLSNGPHGVSAEVVAGAGRTLDKQRTAVAADGLPLWATEQEDPHEPGELNAAHQSLGELVAAIVSPGSEHIPGLMQQLGIGFVLIPAGEGPLADAADTAGGLVRVGQTDTGALWRADVPEDSALPAAPGIAGVATAWARLVDAEGEFLALLPSHQQRIEVDLASIRTPEGEPLEFDSDQEYFLEVAAERAGGWHASLDGESLRPATERSTGEEELPWMRRFHLPADTGELSAYHRSTFQYPVLIGVGLVLVLFLLIAMPLPRSWRIQPVISGAADQRARNPLREETQL
ncbi:hypothetical protein M3B43_11845 [Nesterenkonia massiliensis]|uniref:Glycosyl transferase n=1 Tax=Nesterenkonia massiliensis TaxID=1232429 RepID=A0ABT2HTH7_9MICC|nr:hypothetical protein [Nesterenkonia massiliensis]MCT1607993.1 hypothetical protein [Nesterenkonia massiliensis]